MLQIVRVFRHLMQCQVDRAGIQGKTLLIYLARHQGRIVSQLPHADREIETFPDQIDTPCTQVDIELYLGWLSMNVAIAREK